MRAKLSQGRATSSDMAQISDKKGFEVSAVMTRAQANRETQGQILPALKGGNTDKNTLEGGSFNATETPIEESPSMASSSDDEVQRIRKLEQEDHTGPERTQKSHIGKKELNTRQEMQEVLEKAHNHPMAGHKGWLKTLERVSRQYWWKGMRNDIKAYCRDCLRCKRSKAATHRPYGLLQPLTVPNAPWEQVTFDFITELPPSKFLGQVYDSILVIVDRLTKMAHYVPALSTWTAEDLTQVWMRDVVRLHGVPKLVISDRGVLMKSKTWDTFCHYLASQRGLSSAYHPETDGQTEKQNQTLEQYLRCYCCLEQDDWAIWLSVAEFAYNDSVHSTTTISPFRAYHGADPRGPNWPGQPLGEGEAPLAKGIAAKVLALQRECKAKITAATAYQKKYADRKRMHLTLSVGDKVLVSNRHIRSTRPKKKLDWKYLGPGTVTKVITPVTYQIDLPGLGSVHPVFHISLLEPYNPKGSIQSQDPPIPDTLRQFGDDVYEIDHIIKQRQNAVGVWEYLVKWKDYPDSENSWEPGANISANALQVFWKKKGIKPKRLKIHIRDRGRSLKKKKNNKAHSS